jgi:hypothetical protein
MRDCAGAAMLIGQNTAFRIVCRLLMLNTNTLTADPQSSPQPCATHLSCVQTTGSEKSGLWPTFFVYTRTCSQHTRDAGGQFSVTTCAPSLLAQTDVTPASTLPRPFNSAYFLLCR